MTEGPREDRSDLAEGTHEGPIEPEPRPESESTPAAEPELGQEPGPSPEPTPAAERPAPLFVVAARQTDPESTPDDDVLFIVPAPQAASAPPIPPPLERPAPQPAPAPEPEPEVEPEPAPRRGRRPGCFAFLLLLVIAIVAGAAYAYRSGVLTPRLVLNAAGFAAAEVEFVNLLDTRVTVNLALPNAAGESFPAAIRLEPYDIATHRAPRPNDLSVTVLGLDGESLATCLLRLKAGDRYRIVVLPSRSLIQRGDEAPPDTADLLLDTSSLCR